MINSVGAALEVDIVAAEENILLNANHAIYILNNNYVLNDDADGNDNDDAAVNVGNHRKQNVNERVKVQPLQSFQRITENKNNNSNSNIYKKNYQEFEIQSAFVSSSNNNNRSSNSICSNKMADNKRANNIISIQTLCPNQMVYAALTPLKCVAAQTNQNASFRTLDQETAYRRIEDVHNYAKLRGRRRSLYNSYSNGSSPNSLLYEDDDDDVDDDDDMEEDDDEEDADEDEQLEQHDDLEEHELTADISQQEQQQLNLNNDYKAVQQKPQHNYAYYENYVQKQAVNSQRMDMDMELDVDVETISVAEQQLQQQQALDLSFPITPEHHARRPMNAFLIFCKRHRVIVKNHYNNTENRGITRILGEWWAALDASEKQPFVELAKQNKDAFFSANPNFKWYKLPAPPLRTLNTRPNSLSATNVDELPNNNNNKYNSHIGSTADNIQGNRFKFAAEAEMGQLNMLMPVKQTQQQQQHALQQALGETTQFFNTHMPKLPISADVNMEQQQHTIISTNAPKKSNRSCKGRKYQELLSAGHISNVNKKLKIAKNAAANNNYNADIDDNKQLQQNVSNNTTTTNVTDVAIAAITANDMPQYIAEQINFDLNDQIQKLPALDFDYYLQRKRTIKKKKKKFISKKRNSNSSSTSTNSSHSTTTTAVTANVSNDSMNTAVSAVTPTAATTTINSNATPIVGSQKRKARKHSILRRDISITAIESEMTTSTAVSAAAAASSTTVRGNYIFHNMNTISSVPKASHTIVPINSDAVAITAANIAYSSHNNSSSNINVHATNDNDFNDNSTTTSDLQILAEVAAKRTEFNK